MRPTATPIPGGAGTLRASEERTGMAAAIAAAIIYGAAYPATAVALRSFSPLAVAGLSSTLALVIVLALSALGVMRPSIQGMTRARFGRLLVLALLGGVLFIAVVNIAVSIAGPTITGFVAPLYAVFGTTLAVPLLGERVRIGTIVAFGLAFVGTALLAGAVPTGAPVVGIVLGLIAAAMFGLFLVLARRWSEAYALDGALVTLANLVGRGPILLAIAYVTDPGGVVPVTVDPGAIVALLTIVFGASTSASLLLIASVRRLPSGRTSAALLLTPVASALIAAVVLGERLSPTGLLGAACILVGMAVASGLLPRRSAPAATSGPSPR